VAVAKHTMTNNHSLWVTHIAATDTDGTILGGPLVNESNEWSELGLRYLTSWMFVPSGDRCRFRLIC